eukprot:5842004-Amphidinium_carterae.2
MPLKLESTLDLHSPKLLKGISQTLSVVDVLHYNMLSPSPSPEHSLAWPPSTVQASEGLPAPPSL